GFGCGNVDVEDGGGDGARAGDEWDSEREDADVFARHGFLFLGLCFACAGWSAKKHVYGDEEEEYATGNVKGVEGDAKALKQETTDQGEKCYDACADQDCTRDNGFALFFGEVGGESDDGWSQSDRVYDSEKCDECADCKR